VEEEYYTVQEAARILRTTERTVCKRVARHRLVLAMGILVFAVSMLAACGNGVPEY
jgi:hypothetical protein